MPPCETQSESVVRENRTLRSMSGDGKRGYGRTGLRRAHECAAEVHQAPIATAPVLDSTNEFQAEQIASCGMPEAIHIA